MGESGRLPERFAAAFLFCPQRRISGAFRTPHRGLRFVIALANTTSISCGRFRAQLRAATSDSAPYIRLYGRLFSFIRGRLFSFIPFLSQVRCFALRLPTLRLIFVFADRLFPFLCYDLCRYGKYRSAALGMTNIQNPSPALSPRIVLCGRLFSFIPFLSQVRNFALRLPTLRPIFVSADRLFLSLCYALCRYGKYRSAALGMTNIQKPSPALSPRSVLCGRLFSFIPFLSQVRCFALRLPTLRLIFVFADRLFPFLCYDLCRYGKYRSAALGMTNIQKPSPALSPRSVLCGRLFSFIPFLSQVRCFALRLPTLRTDFFFLFAMPFADTHISIRGAVQPRRSESVRSKNSALSLKNS